MTMRKETTLEVDGMICGSCVRHVQAALRALDGIDKVEVRLADGKVRVEHDPSRPAIDEMFHALRKAGYVSRLSRT